MITAPLDTAEWRAIGSRSIQSHFEESVPVVCRDTVKRFRNAMQSIWLHLRRPASRSIKSAAKVVKRFPALSLFTNNRVCFKPDEQTLIVEVHSAPNRFPIASSFIQQLGRYCC